MSNSTVAWIIAGLALLWSIGMTMFRGGFGLSGKLEKMAISNANAMTAMESRLAQTVAETARDLEERQERSTVAFGESVKAVREQLVVNEKETMGELHELSDRIRQVEIWARDEFKLFVSNEDFREVCARIENTVAEQGRTVNAGVQSVRDAILQLATSGMIDKRDHRTG